MQEDIGVSEELKALSRRVRRAFWRGEITEADALAQLAPYLAAWNAHAAAVAKQLGMRPQKLAPKKYLRMRFDLRWEKADQDLADHEASS